eukprot:13136631-Ditylum_brightwellii.AAC.1
MASFLVGRLATVIVGVLIRSITDDTLDPLIAQGDRQVLKVAHHMHVVVMLFDPIIDLVFDKHIQVLDLFACQATSFRAPFGIFYKLDLLEPLLFCNT